MFGDFDPLGLTIVEVDAGPRWLDGVRNQAATLDPASVMLAVPPGALVCGDHVEIVTAYAEAGAAILTAMNGTALVGLAGAVADGDDDVAVDEDQHVFFHFDPLGTDAVILNGRVLNTAVGAEPLVVLGRGVSLLEQEHDGSRDMTRILRYDDAIADPTPTPRVVAPEIISMPFWTPAFCATVIRAAESVEAFVPNADDPVPGHEVSLAAISPRLFAHLEDDLASRVMPGVRSIWPYAEFHGLRDAFVIKYSLFGQTELRIHHDVAQISGTVALNRGFDGGRLEFPRQEFDNRQQAVGDLLVWPSLVTHPHRSSPLQRGVKYALTLWFEIPGSDSPRVM